MRVSLPTTAESGRLQAILAVLCAMAMLALGAAATAPPAHAAFALNRCEGASVEGEGSSLQKLAQANWISQIFDTTIYGGCGASAPKVTFTTASSGCGLDAMGAGIPASECKFGKASKEEWEKKGFRPENVRFGAADFAPDPEEEKNMDDGPTGAGTAGAGQVHVIPVAGAAITVVVHFPNGCALQNPAQKGGNDDTSTGGYPVPRSKEEEEKEPLQAGEEDRNNDPAGGFTKDKFSNQTLRVHITDQELEEIWQHHITTWGQIVPEADFLSSGVSKTQKECAETKIIRIVREDTSGTTYNFKHFLALLPLVGGEGGEKLWTAASSQVGNTNTVWPLKGPSEPGTPIAASDGTKTADLNGTELENTPPKNECSDADGNQICHALEGSGGSLSNAVIATNGSIGYLDMATAREKGYNMTPNTTGEETKNDRLYWIPLQPVEPSSTPGAVGTVDQSVFIEPTVEATAHFNGGAETKGANCAGADWRGYPHASESPNGDPTLGDWSKAIATGDTNEAITKKPTTAYPVCALTYDLAFDDNAAAFGTGGEEEAKARSVWDYLTSVVSYAGQYSLPSFDYAALPNEIVEAAQKGVAAIGWDKSAGVSGGGKEEVKTSPVTTTKSIPTVIAPIVPSNAFSITSAKVKGKNIVLTLVLPDAGSVQVKATGGGVTVGSASASTSGGKGTVTLAISKSTLSKLAKAKGHKLSVKIAVTFTPTGGTAATQTKTLTLTQAAVSPPKKKTSKKGKKK
jgi:hypothetical protein